MLVLPPVFTEEAGTKLYNFLTGFAELQRINTNQINELYDRTHISTCVGDELDKYITDLAPIYRKDSESDSDYKTRYYRYVFRYNASRDQISEIIYDVSGNYPNKLLSLGDRSGYWGKANTEDDTVQHYFYDNAGENKTYWMSSKEYIPFTGYIFLKENLDTATKQEVIKVLNMVRKIGTTLYLVEPVDQYDDPSSIYDLTEYST